MKECNPVSCEAVVSPNEVRRFLFCQHYDTCLEHAIKSCWESFSCEKCQCYERVEWDREQWAEDYSRCMTLAYFVALAGMKSRPKNKYVPGLSHTLKFLSPDLEGSLSAEAAQ
ncbi:MAG: hypothetical protein AB2L11_04970 [Syntrophobacteraceae bacterium]